MCWEWTLLFEGPGVIHAEEIEAALERSTPHCVRQSLDAVRELEEARRSQDAQRILRAERAAEVADAELADFFREVLRLAGLKRRPKTASAVDLT